MEKNLRTLYVFGIGAVAAILFLLFAEIAMALQPSLRALISQLFGFYWAGEGAVAWGIFILVGFAGSLSGRKIQPAAFAKVLRVLYWTGIVALLAAPGFLIFQLLYF